MSNIYAYGIEKYAKSIENNAESDYNRNSMQKNLRRENRRLKACPIGEVKNDKR